MKKIKAEIVADSINSQGDRITTYLLTFPRFILAELNTHRVFSKNSASSRAIPFKKMVEMVETDPFIPIAWQKEHKGMQGSEYIVKKDDIQQCTQVWLKARNYAIKQATSLGNAEGFTKVTKQLANRLLEPFMWHTVLLTGTEFENFFELRCPQYYYEPENKYFKSKEDYSDYWFENFGSGIEEAIEGDPTIWWLEQSKSGAEIHIQVLAEAMWDAMNESAPKELKEGEWHIPFGDRIQLAHTDYDSNGIITNEGINKKLKISTARCARLSYMTFDGKIDYEKDLKLHNTLLESQHMSPFEHCARAMSNEEYQFFIKGKGVPDYNLGISSSNPVLTFRENEKGWCRNFKGFVQYRYLIENES